MSELWELLPTLTVALKFGAAALTFALSASAVATRLRSRARSRGL
ncbi:hypothetical protein [Streptomyces sp. NBC_00091]|nr:hypothetical protein [Streptomyces sp. NBC_00091]MCX5377735.1 hypothetical protein [Streptomyces sp. NBC_00091]